MKIIVVTGASDGIGAEMARQLATRYGTGVGLILAARSEPRLNAGISAQALFEDVQPAGIPAASSGLKEKNVMSVMECARLIITAMDRRQREVLMTAKEKLGLLLKLLAPGAVEAMALAALKNEGRPA